MTAVPGGDLGTFTTAELQLTGINRRGFLQPLLPEPGGGTRDGAGSDGDQSGDRVGDRGGHEAGAAVLQGLVDRGLLVPSGDRWRPAGALEVVLVIAATAGSVVAHHPHEGDADRLLLGAAGGSGQVLDLEPTPDGWAARLVGAAVAGDLLVDLVGLAGSPPGADGVAPVGPVDPAWEAVSGRLASVPVTHRIEAAACRSPDGPLLQQRCTVALAPQSGAWLLLGRRSGDERSLAAAPAGPCRLARLMQALLRGEPAQL